MTEEIIIDGVNVAGCTLFYNAYNENMCARVDGLKCREDDNCNYKQLKRLEQERDKLKEKYKEDHAELLMARSKIESLKSNLEEFVRRVDFAVKENDKLEQENKELRQQYNCYACDTCQGKEDYRNMKRHCENAIKTVHKYRSALEEIRVIADDTFKVCDDDCGNARKIKLIIDKINECIGG